MGRPETILFINLISQKYLKDSVKQEKILFNKNKTDPERLLNTLERF